ncbi:MAG: DUF3108 domain-containing protein [Burkholderiales bacterium]|nr:DUF3108 domain-containing protein [Burkholderiales bacterium]
MSLSAPSGARARRRRRRGALAAMVLGVVALHWWALAGRSIGAGDAAPRGAVQAMQVRQIVRQIAQPIAVATTPGPQAAGDARTARAAMVASKAAPAGPTVVAPPAAPAHATVVAPEVTDVAERAAAGFDAAHAAASPATLTTPPVVAARGSPAGANGGVDGGVEPPRYATRLPPAVTLHYDFERRAGRGDGALVWRLDGSRYELSLRGGSAGAEAIGWTSRGRIDGNGTAPERFVARRRGRDLLAVNFLRDGADGGRITFSGPSLQLPLWRGVQDRVSWMLQLAGVLDAEPALGAVGASVSMWVVGPRGDAEVWTFVVQPRDAVDLPAGGVEGAVHLVREATRPYDTRISVWLDPARHHLPVRTLLETRPGGESTEFRLRALNYD